MAEDDQHAEMHSKMVSYYQHFIRIPHWIVELSRVHIITEVSVLASQMAMPRRGGLDAALHVYPHLRSRTNAQMIFNPTYPEINHSELMQHDWTQFYCDVKEAIR